MNKFKELKINLNNETVFKGSESKSVLILLLLGNKNVINICYKIIIDILTGNRENKKTSRTVIMFQISEKLFKLVTLGLSKIKSVDPLNNLDKNNIYRNIIDINDKNVNKLLKI
jgi:hypothetical protein